MTAQKSGAAPQGRPTAELVPPGTVHLPPVYHTSGENARVAAWKEAESAAVVMDGVYPLLQRVQLGQVATSYPAVLVMGRATEKGPKAFVDGLILSNAAALEQRLAMFLSFEMNGAIPYHFVIAAVTDAQDMLQAAREELADYHEDQDTRFAAQRGVA